MGKVLLERMLSLLPDIAAVYVLVRPKTRAGAAAISIDERLKQEVFESQIFEPLKDRMGDAFDGLFDSKVHAVSGDVAMDKPGPVPGNIQAFARRSRHNYSLRRGRLLRCAFGYGSETEYIGSRPNG